MNKCSEKILRRQFNICMEYAIVSIPQIFFLLKQTVPLRGMLSRVQLLLNRFRNNLSDDIFGMVGDRMIKIDVN